MTERQVLALESTHRRLESKKKDLLLELAGVALRGVGSKEQAVLTKQRMKEVRLIDFQLSTIEKDLSKLRRQ